MSAFAFASKLFAVVISLACAGMACAEDDAKKKADELRSQIAQKRAELTKLEAELARLDPEKPKAVNYLWVNDLKEGTYGHFGEQTQISGRLYEGLAAIEVVSVIDGKSMLIRLATGSPNILVVNFDTKGLADGKIIVKDPPLFKVNGTQKLNGRTVYVVEPYTPEPPAKQQERPAPVKPMPPKKKTTIPPGRGQ